MHTDELRAELTELANDVAPFEGDLRGIRRRVARRRVAVASAAAIVIIAAVAGVVGVTRTSARKVDVAGHTKELTAAALPRVDAIVILPGRVSGDDTGRVQRALDTTGVVQSYARLRPGALTTALNNPLFSLPASLRAEACSNPTSPSFAVELSRPFSSSLQTLAAATGTGVVVSKWPGRDADVEVFMNVKANDQQVLAVSSALHSDPDVGSIRFLDHDAAYQEFKKLFHDQPVLVQNETPAGLPESFKVLVRGGVTPASLSPRYRGLSGVSSVIVAPNPFASSQLQLPGAHPSCLAKP